MSDDSRLGGEQIETSYALKQTHHGRHAHVLLPRGPATDHGKLWGRPPSGVESKFLLTGFAVCGICGGSLCVRSRSDGRFRAYFYGARRPSGKAVKDYRGVLTRQTPATRDMLREMLVDRVHYTPTVRNGESAGVSSGPSAPSVEFSEGHWTQALVAPTGFDGMTCWPEVAFEGVSLAA